MTRWVNLRIRTCLFGLNMSIDFYCVKSDGCNLYKYKLFQLYTAHNTITLHESNMKVRHISI